MNKHIRIYLGIFCVALVAIVAFFGLYPNGDKASLDPYFLSTRPAQTASPAFSLLNQATSGSTPTVDLTQSKNCTYTYYFWRDHPEAWPDTMEIAGQSIPKSRAAQIMQAPSNDPVLELQRVLYVTLLNISSGADREAIDKTIQDASEWLVANASRSKLSGFDQTVATLFILDLENYNNGLLGPDPCLNQPRTPTPTATSLIQTQPVLPSVTPSPSQTAANLTSTPFVPISGQPSTRIPTAEIPEPPTDIAAPPSSTPVPPSATPEPSTGTPPLPSNTPTPPRSTPVPPTNTPITPTGAPTPTLIQTPIITMTPKPSPTPTNTRTPHPPYTPTSTAEPPTNTPTPEPPTPTLQPATDTPIPEPPTSTPTPTLQPATNTPIPEPPTSTPTLEPTSTKTPKVKPTHKP